MKPILPSLQPHRGHQADPRERRAARRVAERILEHDRTFEFEGATVPAAVLAAWVLRFVGGYAVTEDDMLEHVCE